MRTLVFDIETVGEEFDALDETTQGVLTRWIDEEAFTPEERASELRRLKEGLGFSPFTGEIVAIGMLDVEQDKPAVYFQAPGEAEDAFEEDGVLYRPYGEKEMLEHFWRACGQYGTFVSFNGRGFDVPFLMIRSMAHGLTPSVDLMANRYLSYQRGVRHVDLLDQLTFYGATRKRPNLHLVCRALGVESPKAGGITGDDVAGLFREKKFREIARYNVGDLRATRDVYRAWREHLAAPGRPLVEEEA